MKFGRTLLNILIFDKTLRYFVGLFTFFDYSCADWFGIVVAITEQLLYERIYLIWELLVL